MIKCVQIVIFVALLMILTPLVMLAVIFFSPMIALEWAVNQCVNVNF